MCNEERDQWLLDAVRAVRQDVSDIKASVSGQQVTLARNTTSLEYHVKRTDLAEESIRSIRAEMKPLVAHVELEATIARWVFSSGFIAAVGILLKLAGLV